MNANDLRNAILALNFIDFDDFRKAILAGVARWNESDIFISWENFMDSPARYYTRAPDNIREALFALIQEHLEKEKAND